jgi:hypothetical protein
MEKHRTEQKSTKLTARNVVRSRELISIERLLRNTLVDSNATAADSRVSQVSSTAITLIPVQKYRTCPSLEASPKNSTRRSRNVNSYVLTVID